MPAGGAPGAGTAGACAGAPPTAGGGGRAGGSALRGGLNIGKVLSAIQSIHLISKTQTWQTKARPGWVLGVVRRGGGRRVQGHRGQGRGQVLQKLVLLRLAREAEIRNLALKQQW